MPYIKYEGLHYPIYFLKGRGGGIRNNFPLYRTKQANIFAQRNFLNSPEHSLDQGELL